MEGTPAAEDQQIEMTSATENTEIEATLATAEHKESGERTQWPKNSIFRAPAHIRSSRELHFEPKYVSIGPYHHGQPKLKHMEDLKLRCIPEILKKEIINSFNPKHSEAFIPRLRQSIYNVPAEPSTQEEMGIDDVPIDPFLELEGDARAYYKHEVKQERNDFVRMLVLDSLFLIRTILSLSRQLEENNFFLDVHIKDVRSDLLLLENQIPLFFIRKVYEWLFPCSDHPEVHLFETFLEPFICLDMPWRINKQEMSSDAAHLLDLYWRCSLPPWIHGELISEIPSWFEPHFSYYAPMVMANAAELQEMAGIEFEKFKHKDHLDVNFSNGIMRLPRLKIDTRQTTLLVNVIAYENCVSPTWRIFSGYMKLMDSLIDSEKDVKLLQKCGVIYNSLSSHERAATFFNDIGNFCFIDYTSPFSNLYWNVQEYYDSSWHHRLASLQQKYFSSPWAIISVVAAVVLLVFSAIQTLFTVLGYFYPKN